MSDFASLDNNRVRHLATSSLIYHYKICNKVRERLKRHFQVAVIDEGTGFGLKFVEEAQERFTSTIPNLRESLQGRAGLGIINCLKL